MNRCEWEADAIARRRGYADRHELFAALAAERLATLRRQREADERATVGDWIRRFDKARQENCA